MNSQTIMRAKGYTKKVQLLIGLLAVTLFFSVAHAWEIDLSRRRKNVQKRDVASEVVESNAQRTDSGLVQMLDNVLPPGTPRQEIVILSTENGFVPRSVRLKKDMPYTIYIVNVNEKEKNVSFILDSFSEHHGTYFGKIKKFEVTPKKEGIFSFYCPETSAEGKMVIHLGESQRGLASESPSN